MSLGNPGLGIGSVDIRRYFISSKLNYIKFILRLLFQKKKANTDGILISKTV